MVSGKLGSLRIENAIRLLPKVGCQKSILFQAHRQLWIFGIFEILVCLRTCFFLFITNFFPFFLKRNRQPATYYYANLPGTEYSFAYSLSDTDMVKFSIISFSILFFSLFFYRVFERFQSHPIYQNMTRAILIS